MSSIVVKPHTSNYPDPISFVRGDRLSLGHRDNEYPGWIRTTTRGGNRGWAPEKLIEITSEHAGFALDSYTAKELDVCVGERVEVMRELCGWLWVCNETHQEGWIPASSVGDA